MRARWLIGVSLAASLVCGTSLVRAEEGEFKSGLQPGEPASPFNCRDITGPNKGKSLCYV
jgi:hypothetical protein